MYISRDERTRRDSNPRPPAPQASVLSKLNDGSKHIDITSTVKTCPQTIEKAYSSLPNSSLERENILKGSRAIFCSAVFFELNLISKVKYGIQTA